MEVNQDSKSQQDDQENADVVDSEECVQASEENDEAPQASLEETVVTLEKENQELKSKFLRTVADMENMRKRTEKEKSEIRKFANEKIMNDLLSVLDSFDKAVCSEDGQNTNDSYIEGVKMVQKQLLSVCSKHGLLGFDSQGKEFDPNWHQAIQRLDDDQVDTEVVKEEFQKGYKLNDRLLRPAIVSVSVPATKE